MAVNASGRQDTIALAMIVRNEEAVLARCLDSAVGVVDEMVIVDTGSTDRTKSLVQSYADRVPRLVLLDFEWCDDFAAARNFALENVAADWALHLDADEELAPSRGVSARSSTPKRLKAALQSCVSRSQEYALRVQVETSSSADPSEVASTSGPAPRLLRMASHVRYRGRVHESPWAEHGAMGRCDNVRVVHFGPHVSGENLVLEKHQRNRRLLEIAVEEEPEDDRLHLMLAYELLWFGEIEGAREALLGVIARHSPVKGGAPVHRAVLLYCALCDGLLGNADAGIARLDDLLGVQPAFTDARFLLGELLGLRGELRIASETFRDCRRMGDVPPGIESWGGSGSWRPTAALDDLADYLRDPVGLRGFSVVGFYARRGALFRAKQDADVRTKKE